MQSGTVTLIDNRTGDIIEKIRYYSIQERRMIIMGWVVFPHDDLHFITVTVRPDLTI